MSDSWSAMAPRRREQIESGQDLTFTKVFLPFYRESIRRIACTSLIEIGCGTGHLVKEFTQIGQQTYALEPSPGMHAVAANILRDSGVVLINRAVEQYETGLRFDCVISHLCAQAVSDLDRFLRSCAGLLEKHGRFIFSIPHPCFWNDYQPYFEEDEFDYSAEQFTNATLTISLDRESKMPGIPFYHRPLSRYIDAIVAAGLEIHRLTEIFPSQEVQKLYPIRWARPRYCVFEIGRESAIASISCSASSADP